MMSPVRPAMERDTQCADRTACRVELMRISFESFAFLFICLGKCEVKIICCAVKIICWQLWGCCYCMCVKNYGHKDMKQLDSLWVRITN